MFLKLGIREENFRERWKIICSLFGPFFVFDYSHSTLGISLSSIAALALTSSAAVTPLLHIHWRKNGFQEMPNIFTEVTSIFKQDYFHGFIPSDHKLLDSGDSKEGTYLVRISNSEDPCLVLEIKEQFQIQAIRIYRKPNSYNLIARSSQGIEIASDRRLPDLLHKLANKYCMKTAYPRTNKSFLGASTE